MAPHTRFLTVPRGNTHFPFSDLNNVEIADLVSKFLTEKTLD